MSEWGLPHWRMVAKTMDEVIGREKVVLTSEQAGTILHGCREAGWQHTDIDRFVASLKPTAPPMKALRRIGQRCVGADDPRLFAGLSRFYWTWCAIHDRDRLRREMDADVAAGYDYARVLLQVGNLGGTYWDGREVDQDDIRHESAVAYMLGEARQRGLYLLPTFIGKGFGMDREERRRPYCERAAAVLSEFREAVLVAEVMNEPGMLGHIDAAEILDLAAVVEEIGGVLTATGAVWGEGGATAFTSSDWRATQRGIGIAHLDRSFEGSDGKDRPWRQPWDIGLELMPWINNEPIGPGASVNSEDRPAVLRSHGTVAFMSGAFATCFHADAGIRGYSEMPEEAYRLFPSCKKHLPGDFPDWGPTNANQNYPHRHWTLPSCWLRSESGAGPIRVYGRTQGKTQVSLAFGSNTPFELDPQRDISYQAIDMETADGVIAKYSVGHYTSLTNCMGNGLSGVAEKGDGVRIIPVGKDVLIVSRAL